MNNLSQSVYAVYANKVNKEKKVTAFEINFYFALVGLPVTLYITQRTGEIYLLQDVLMIEDFNHKISFLISLLLSGVMGIIITCSALMVVTLCNPVANNITGNLKDVILTYIGFICFDDAILSATVALGLMFSFLGAANYVHHAY